ncbi:hypothetical protein Tco_0262080 [Tanacetum coccineum]
MDEINNFQKEPDESLFRVWERFKEFLMKCPQHYLIDMQEVILFYNGLAIPTRQILDSKGAIPSKTAADAKIAIQEMAEYSQKWHNGTSSRTRSTKTSNGLAAIQAQLNNLGREIKKVNKKVYAAQFGAPYQPDGQYREAGPGFYQQNNGNSSYPDRRPSLEESLTIFMGKSAKMHEENSNIIKELQLRPWKYKSDKRSWSCKKEGLEACPALRRQTLETKLNLSQLLKLIFLRYAV